MNIEERQKSYKALWIIAAIAIFLSPFPILFSACTSGTEVNGHLISIEKDTSDRLENYPIGNFHLPQNILSEYKTYPDEFIAYCVNYNLKNVSKHTISDLATFSSKKYSNLWIYQGALYEEFPMNLEAGETTSGGILVLVKVDNMSESQIEQLINGIGIGFSYYNFDPEEQDSSSSFLSHYILKLTTIYFNKS